MDKRFKSIGIFVIFVFLLFGLAGWFGSKSIAAEEKKFLADRHQAKGVNCAGCHKESPPKSAVPGEVCMKCHGSYAKIARKTDNVTPNPHASHLGEIACETCHHAHKASVNHCAECHEFNFKVP